MAKALAEGAEVDSGGGGVPPTDSVRLRARAPARGFGSQHMAGGAAPNGMQQRPG